MLGTEDPSSDISRERDTVPSAPLGLQQPPALLQYTCIQ